MRIELLDHYNSDSDEGSIPGTASAKRSVGEADVIGVPIPSAESMLEEEDRGRASEDDDDEEGGESGFDSDLGS